MRYLIIIFLFLFSSCTHTFYLKKAERALKKAEQLGAKVSADTVWTTVKFEGAKTILSPTIFNRTEYYNERLKLKDTTIYQDRIKIELKDSLIYVQCPDEQQDVPSEINNKIESGISFAKIIQWCVFTSLLTAVILISIYILKNNNKPIN